MAETTRPTPREFLVQCGYALQDLPLSMSASCTGNGTLAGAPRRQRSPAPYPAASSCAAPNTKFTQARAESPIEDFASRLSR
jgi:hypothetical protein